MIGQYDPLLVVLSVLLGMAASFTALSLLDRMFKAPLRVSRWWLWASAIALGTGIWSLHFVGMLAFKLPIPIVYGWGLTAASLVVAIGASAVVMQILSRPVLSWGRAVCAAATLALGVCVMHYSGMAAIQVAPGIVYDWQMVAASALVAMAVASASLAIIYFLRLGRIASRLSVRLSVALVMGLAIASMHYTGMEAAHFDLASIGTSDSGISPAWLAGSIAFFTLILMGMGVVSTIVDSHMADRQQRFHSSLSQSNASLRKANNELTRLASNDVLTNLPNRALLNDQLIKKIQSCPPEQGRVSVLFIDLDRFKVVNESQGHHVGDELLVIIAARLVAAVGAMGMVGRLGGDEFVVMTTEPRLQRVADCGEAILKTLACGFRIGRRELHLSASIGISSYPEDASDAASLLICADTAKHHAKQSGRNKLQFYSPSMRQSAHQRMAIEDGLRRALRDQQFELFYQPKIDVASGRVTSYEALLRWRHPERGLVSPGDFIPIAEESGTIVPIGEWVLNEACRQARAWILAGITTPRVAINVSARQCHERNFSQIVEQALERSSLPPELLEIELTESTVMDEPERAIAMLERLSQLGVQISIDDFGTGYSSLSSLRRLPLNKLKIDRSFIQGLADGSQDVSIVSAIISMAHSLDLEVIAEGVETINQLSILRDLGCDQFQGFLFSPPVPAAQAIELLDKDPITMPAPQTRARWHVPRNRVDLAVSDAGGKGAISS